MMGSSVLPVGDVILVDSELMATPRSPERPMCVWCGAGSATGYGARVVEPVKTVSGEDVPELFLLHANIIFG